MVDKNRRDNGSNGPHSTLCSLRAVDSPRTAFPRSIESKPPVRAIDRHLYEALREVRHQWTAVLAFEGDHEEHHRFSDEDDLALFLRLNRRYRVKRTFQTVIHPHDRLPGGPVEIDPVVA